MGAGRRGLMAERQYNLGIDLGGSNVKFALIDDAGAVVANDRIPTDGEDGHDAVIARMAEGARRLIARTPEGGTVASIGVAVPGVIDMEEGTSIFLPNLPGDWPDVPVTPVIREATGIPTWLINDVRAFTVAEHQLGAARGVMTAICYAIGTGIGGGVVAHGMVNFGVGGAGGELGHVVVAANGPVCGCGNRGCAEAFASGASLIGEANRRLVMGATTILRDMVDDDLNRMTPEIIEEAAQQGDEIARDVLDYAGFHLGLGVAGAIAALAPEAVIFGGGAIRPHGYYWEQIEKSARAHCHVTDIDKVDFRPAALGYEAGVIGAALYGRTRTTVSDISQVKGGF